MNNLIYRLLSYITIILEMGGGGPSSKKKIKRPSDKSNSIHKK